MKINYLDLFSGIGGFAYGLNMAGIEFDYHAFSEIDPYAIKVYRRHYPHAVELGDVSKIDGKKLGRIDVISGGFPCQDISYAGHKEGLEGVRSGLFYQVIRIARDCTPRVIFMENVSNLLAINGGGDFGEVLRELASIGYDTEWHCVPASHVGTDHGRERVWIISYPTSKRRCSMVESCEGKLQEKYSQMFQEWKANKDNLSLSMEGAFNNPGCGIERNDYGLSEGMDRLKAIGNAVVPQVVAYLTELIVKPLLLSNTK